MKLNLPSYNTRVAVSASGERSIYDRLRQKYVALTPEEWVRQHFVEFMIVRRGYPQSLMANEVGITLNGTKRRCDTVVFDRHGCPVMIVEYKAPTIEVTQKTFDQIVRYNMVLRVKYLVVSNGLTHYCCAIDYQQMSYRFLPDVPEYALL